MEPSENQSKSFLARYRLDFVLCFIALILLALELVFFSNAFYWEGLGIFRFGTWFLLALINFIIGAIFFVIFIVIIIVKFKKNPKTAIVFRLSIAVFLLIAFSLISRSVWIFGEPRHVKFSEGFRERIDKRCDADKMRAWSESFLHTKINQGRYFELEEKQIPDFVRDIYPDESFNKNVRVSIQKKDDIKYIHVIWGGALVGHWGIDIGPENLNLENDEDRYYLKWQSGIYIWHDVY